MHCLVLCKATTRFRDRGLSHAKNFFHKNQCPLSLNSDYMVIFGNPRDNSQFANMARQICPDKMKFLM